MCAVNVWNAGKINWWGTHNKLPFARGCVGTVCACTPGAVSGSALWNECLSMLMFGWGISVTAHEAGAEQMWDKAVFPASRELMGREHRWTEQAQEKLQKRAARKGCLAGKSCSRGAASAALLPRALVVRGLPSMGRAECCWEALPSEKLCLCTEATLFWELEVDITVGPEVGTDLVPMERWSVGYDDLDGELGSGFWQSAQVECLCRQTHFQRKRRVQWSRHSSGESFLCTAASEGSPLLQNSRKSLTEGHGLNVSPTNSGILCPCCGWTGLLRADVHTTWERQRA